MQLTGTPACVFKLYSLARRGEIMLPFPFSVSVSLFWYDLGSVYICHLLGQRVND